MASTWLRRRWSFRLSSNKRRVCGGGRELIGDGEFEAAVFEADGWVGFYMASGQLCCGFLNHLRTPWDKRHLHGANTELLVLGRGERAAT